MRLSPIDADTLGLVEAWLADSENYNWLDFGVGRQVVSGSMLRLMAAHKHNCWRLFTPDSCDTPVGLVALSDISLFRTALLWYVLGNKDYQGQGLTTSAVSMILDLGFRQFNLNSIQAWTVTNNKASVQVLLKNGFRSAGRFRQTHMLGGVPADRLLFDLLASDRAS